MTDMNISQENIKNVSQFLQQNSEPAKEVTVSEIESVFNSMSDNGKKEVDANEFAIKLVAVIIPAS